MRLKHLMGIHVKQKLRFLIMAISIICMYVMALCSEIDIIRNNLKFNMRFTISCTNGCKIP